MSIGRDYISKQVFTDFEEAWTCRDSEIYLNTVTVIAHTAGILICTAHKGKN